MRNPIKRNNSTTIQNTTVSVRYIYIYIYKVSNNNNLYFLQSSHTKIIFVSNCYVCNMFVYCNN